MADSDKNNFFYDINVEDQNFEEELKYRPYDVKMFIIFLIIFIIIKCYFF